MIPSSKRTELAEAYVRLLSLKEHLPQIPNVGDTYITEYHQILSLSEKASGADLRGFRLAGALQSIPEHRDSVTGKVDWTCLIDRNVLLMKADGLLRFLELATSDQESTSIGFRPPSA